MAKPNYSFEKRQRELANKKKKEEKAKDKADRKSGVPGAPDEPEEVSGDAPAPNTAAAPDQP
jgi:hypothetical protein